MAYPHRLLPLALALVAAPLLPACSYDVGAQAGDFGVTPGGAQDLRFARARIEAGYIPDAESYRVEGIFSEHDLPIASDSPCERLLCPRSAVARTTLLDGSERLLVQLGFATNTSPETFTRRPLNLAVAVDISGSMTGEKLDSVKEALHTLVDQLGADDRLSLIAFDDEAELRLPSTEMNLSGRSTLKKAIDKLATDGGTNIEAGLSLAYAQVDAHDGASGVEDRVLLLTDAQPNVGATNTSSFMGQARARADQGIGLTVLGVGLDLGAELAQEIATVRGGNYFYLADAEAIAAVFDDEFEMMVTPLAYDLEVRIATAAGWRFAEAFGAPLDEPGTEVDFGASTLFLSSRGGGMGLTLEPGEGGTLPASAEALATFDLAYLPVGAQSPVDDALTVPWQGGAPYQTDTVAADDVGVFKMAVLIDEYMALQAGSAFCAGQQGAAAAIEAIERAADNLDAAAAVLSDEGLADEAALMRKLAENVGVGVERCDAGYY